MNAPSRGLPFRPDPFARREAALTSLARAAIITAKRTRDKSVRNSWRDDSDADLIVRSAVTPTAISGSDAAALATIKIAFIAALTPVSAAAQVIARSLGLTFDGATQISIPALTLPKAQWISEGASIPVVQGHSSSGAMISPHKIAVITSLTNELIARSNAESVVRQILVEGVAPALDAAMFSTDAGTPGLQPPGILNGIAPLAASSAGGNYDNMIDDVGDIVQALAPVSGSGQPVIIAAPKQAVALGMAARDPLSVLSSAALPVGTVVGVVPEALATVVESPRLDASGEVGSLNMEDAPAEIVDGSGTVARPIMSVFQTDSTALRLIMPATWALRSSSAVAWVEGVHW